tara:strand:+ start:4647 stop:5675 length:1029 start_codon:yes stop_codon:yes gene_type:complete
MYHPTYIEEYLIYDVYHNDLDKLIVVMPSVGNKVNIEYNNIKLISLRCNHGHSVVYTSPNKVEYKEQIKLKINNIEQETRVNKYPIFENEIILSTMVKNEDNYIKQWIKYHLNIGVNRVIIYDNVDINDNLSYESIEKKSNLTEVLKNYIDEKKVILIKWPYLKRYSRRGSPNGQTTQQCHSIQAFKKARLIGLFDIDEYVNIQKEKNIHNFFDDYIKINNCNLDNIGGFALKCKFFFNNNNLPVNDFLFLNVLNCGDLIDTRNGNGKQFVQPLNVNTFSIHNITNGKSKHLILNDVIYFNHYIFLNKPKNLHRRYKGGCNKLDNTILENAGMLTKLSINDI